MFIGVKICGLKDEAALKAVIAAQADYAGFVTFPKSPRHIAPAAAGVFKRLLPKSIRSVSVLVDPDDMLLDEIQSVFQPNFLQLHGSESPERLRDIKARYPHARLIKAISVCQSDDVKIIPDFTHVADMLLFDAKAPESAVLPGGNGIAFDWDILKGKHFPLPWMLSGGLTPGNVAQAIHASGALMVDVSSGVERAPGVKDPALIADFMKAVRAI